MDLLLPKAIRERSTLCGCFPDCGATSHPGHLTTTNRITTTEINQAMFGLNGSIDLQWL